MKYLGLLGFLLLACAWMGGCDKGNAVPQAGAATAAPTTKGGWKYEATHDNFRNQDEKSAELASATMVDRQPILLYLLDRATDGFSIRLMSDRGRPFSCASSCFIDVKFDASQPQRFIFSTIASDRGDLIVLNPAGDDGTFFERLLAAKAVTLELPFMFHGTNLATFNVEGLRFAPEHAKARKGKKAKP